MSSLVDKYKGIHPGIVLERLLNKQGIPQRPFALSVGEYPQTINAITKGRRKLNTALALKIEDKLGLEEGTLALLQTYFDIAEERHKALNKKSPDLSLLRSSLFWDTDFEKIDWEKQYKAVIQRVFERGNEQEKIEIKRFYGADEVSEVLSDKEREPYVVYKNNSETFEENLKPMSLEDFNREIDKALEDEKDNRIISVRDLKKQIQKWS